MTPTKKNANDQSISVTNRLRHFWTECGWLTLGCLFVLMAVQSEANNAETSAMKANRERVEEMTARERERLKTNQEKFRKLSPAEKQSIREFHTAVAADNDLNSTLAAYHHWLGTLPSKERDAVLSADSEHRIEAIERLIAKQRGPQYKPNGDMTQQEIDGKPIRNPRFSLPLWARSNHGGFVFTDTEFRSIVVTLAEWLQTDLRPVEDTKMAALGYRIRVIDLMVTKVSNKSRSPNGGGPRPVIPDDLIRAISQSLPKRTTIRIVSQLRTQPAIFLQTLARTIGAQANHILETDGPTEAQLDEEYDNMPAQRRREHDNADDETRSAMLVRSWLDHRHPEMSRLMRRISSIVIQNKPKRNPNQERRFTPQD